MSTFSQNPEPEPQSGAAEDACRCGHPRHAHLEEPGAQCMHCPGDSERSWKHPFSPDTPTPTPAPLSAERLAEYRELADRATALGTAVAAPGAVPELLDEVARLTAERDELAGQVDYWREGYRIAKGLTHDDVTAFDRVRALHTRYHDSEHCQHDGEPWPCPTVTAVTPTAPAGGEVR